MKAAETLEVLFPELEQSPEHEKSEPYVELPASMA
jgi:hypothetical protein